MSTTQPVQPIRESVIGALRNALQIAQFWGMGMSGFEETDTQRACTKIAELLGVAIEGLSEPNLSAMQAGEILLKEWSGTPEPQRQLRDTIQGILTAQLSGIIPKTWEVS